MFIIILKEPKLREVRLQAIGFMFVITELREKCFYPSFMSSKIKTLTRQYTFLCWNKTESDLLWLLKHGENNLDKIYFKSH